MRHKKERENKIKEFVFIPKSHLTFYLRDRRSTYFPQLASTPLILYQLKKITKFLYNSLLSQLQSGKGLFRPLLFRLLDLPLCLRLDLILQGREECR
jgi:hypothetical protein